MDCPLKSFKLNLGDLGESLVQPIASPAELSMADRIKEDALYCVMDLMKRRSYVKISFTTRGSNTLVSRSSKPFRLYTSLW